MSDGTVGCRSFGILTPVIGDAPTRVFNREEISTVPLVTIESLIETEPTTDH